MKQRMSLCKQSTLHVSNAARGQVVAAAAAASPSRAHRHPNSSPNTNKANHHPDNEYYCVELCSINPAMLKISSVGFTKPDHFRLETRDGPMGGRPFEFMKPSEHKEQDVASSPKL